ncbi:MAG: hypothetical protein M0017_04720 [Desulfobacteraceae bacterium]|nr:hypothetical protein [Desulfobacteraceae bacterium]
MANIGAVYQNNASLLSNSSLIQQAPSSNGSSQNSYTNSTASAATGDQVSLSSAVEEARLRDSLGLPPTGKITRQDITTQIQADQTGVLTAIQDSLNGLGLDPNTPITLTLGTDGQIQVTGAGANTDALTNSLNADANFSQMFSRLATNSKLLSFAGQMQSSSGTTPTLSDYLDNNNNADSKLNMLIQQYEAMKASSGSLAGLISLSNSSGAPFSFSNNTIQNQQIVASTPNPGDFLNNGISPSDLATILQQEEPFSGNQIQAAGTTPTLSDYLNNDNADSN